MNIKDLNNYKESFSAWTLIYGYDHIGVNNEVCGGEPTIVGTNLRPSDISNYGTLEEIAEDFELTNDEIMEAIRYVDES